MFADDKRLNLYDFLIIKILTKNNKKNIYSNYNSFIYNKIIHKIYNNYF